MDEFIHKKFTSGWIKTGLISLVFVFFLPEPAFPMSFQDTRDPDPQSVEQLLEQADQLFFNDPALALVYARQALDLSRIKGTKEDQVRSLYLVGELLMRSSNRNEALPYFDEGMQMAQSAGFRKLTADGHYYISYYHETASEYSDALHHIHEALAIFEELALEPSMANSYNSMGRIYQDLGDFSTSLTYLFEGLRINERLDRKSGMAISNTNIGNTYLKTGNYEEAIRIFHETLRIDEEMENKSGIMLSKLNLGAAYQRNEDYDTAMQYHQESLALARELGYREDEAIILDNIGSTYRKQGFPNEGLPFMFEGLAIMQETGYNTSATLNGISEAYLVLQNYDEALVYSLQADQVGRERNDPGRLRYTYRNMAEAYEGLGNFEMANRALKLYIATKDSLFTTESEKQINQLQILYETEKRDQTISMLTLEAETAAFRRNTYLLSGILVSLILLLLYGGQRYKTRKNRQLFEKSEEVAQMKSSFFSNISHEFRTPLTLISGPIGQIKTRTDDPLIHKELKIMQRNSDRLLDLINQLLDLSRLESGSLKLSVEKSDLISLVRGVTMSFQSLADMRGITLSTETVSDTASNTTSDTISNASSDTSSNRSSNRSSDTLSNRASDTSSTSSNTSSNTAINLKESWVDRGKIETILINLLSNAIKYSPDGGEVMVKISHPVKSDALAWCRIEVADSGEGIPEQDLEHVFDRFYRGSETEYSGTIGSGIGLALTKELVQLHHGDIRVQSTPGKGTVFIVEIPVSENHYSDSEKNPLSPGEVRRETVTEGIADLQSVADAQPGSKSEVEVEAEVETENEAKAEAETETETEAETETETELPLLLLIEDNEDVKNYLTDILNEQYRLITAPDGEAGVDLAMKEIPDLIISDVMMPKMGGYQVAEILKTDEKTSHIPLILLTAKASHDDRIQGLKTHADDYITKPFRPDELLLRVGNLITSRKQLRQKYNRKIEIKPEELSAQSMEEAFLLKVVNTIKKHLLNEGFSVDQLAREVGMSRSQLHRKLVALTDLPATEFIRTYRLNLAKEMIEKNTGSISEIAYEVGFNSPSYFSKAFKEKFGVSPSEFGSDNGIKM